MTRIHGISEKNRSGSFEIDVMTRFLVRSAVSFPVALLSIATSVNCPLIADVEYRSQK